MNASDALPPQEFAESGSFLSHCYWQQDPQLIAYFRLLYGLSQKEFYRTLGRFKSMEERGTISDRAGMIWMISVRPCARPLGCSSRTSAVSTQSGSVISSS